MTGWQVISNWRLFNQMTKLLSFKDKNETDINPQFTIINASDIIPKSNAWIPNKFFQPLERYFGWNLYAKGYKPSE